MATENPRVWFKSISLENVRSFGTKQTINFTDKDGNAARWNVILGDNGTGKTTVLKCIYISAQNSYSFYEYEWSYKGLARINSKGPNVMGLVTGVLGINDNEEKVGFSTKYVPLESGRFSVDILDEFNFTLPERNNFEVIYAYGAARRISAGILNNYAEDERRVVNLFSENSALLNAEKWLIQAEYISLKEPKFATQFLIVLNILKKLFRGEVSDIFIKTETGEPRVFFKTHYGDVRLHELSLGYKTLIAWMVDFAKGLLDRYPDSENPLAEPAVCLVDEIDLHLHPKFQRTIIQFLTETFPNTQFIVTAHSPLIVQSAEDANIILLKREGSETVVADSIDVHSWRVDQILSSDLFGGISPRPPQAEDRMQRRRALLLKDSRTEKEDKELEQLDEELGQLKASESEEALKALELIGKVLSK
ncbi:AAA family ATPase [Spirosoma linguale]|uniref:SMC domain protein n=1 Tax=Spirosoma linguale (strain ATCC 33905 / DSM 74 / LMG 10896 / Claus 1) TaxID=504472 RepID=D2QU17_SPILD|nr:SMC domain protein [Spirosoma linguale DSM 74]